MKLRDAAVVNAYRDVYKNRVDESYWGSEAPPKMARQIVHIDKAAEQLSFEYTTSAEDSL